MSQPAFKPERKSAKTLTEFLGEKSNSRRYVPMDQQIEKAREEMPMMARAGDWGDATGMHMAALYCFLHTEVYGVEPLELDRKAWAGCAKMAASCAEKFFGGDYGQLAVFVRWVWRREQGREAWRRQNGRDGQRIGWRYQFATALVSDFRVHGQRVGQ